MNTLLTLKQRLIAHVLLAAVLAFVMPLGADASSLKLIPQENPVGASDPFTIAVMLVADEPINAVTAELKIPEGIIPEDINEGNSVVSLWVGTPTWDELNRTITFSGIIPGGYTGVGELIRISFSAHDEIPVAQFTFNLEETVAYVQGPRAVPAKLYPEPLSLSIGPFKQNIANEVTDTERPEKFNAFVEQSPYIYDGAWFVAFATHDKLSGIAKYQIAERPGRPTRFYNSLSWKDAQTPYLLTDQTLKSTIYIKAIDKAGNERFAVIAPRYPLGWYDKPKLWITIIGIGLLVVLYILWRRKKSPTF